MGTGGPPVTELTLTLKSLLYDFKSYKVIHSIETEREVIEGKYHTGVGAVVQLIVANS